MPAKRVGMVAVLVSWLLASTVSAQMRTEVRDPLRGVSFHSIGLSDEPMNELAVLDGAFSDRDRLAVGISVLQFDASHRSDEYILWLRHEGRRWLDFEVGHPVMIEVDGRTLDLAQLRASQPFVGEASFYEKIELKVAPGDLQAMLSGDRIRMRLSSGNGVVEKTLTTDELATLRAFIAEVSDSAS